MDEEVIGEEENEGTKALKRRRRQEAPHTLVNMSSKEEQKGFELPDPSSTRGIKKVRERSNPTKASFLDVVEMLRVGIGSKSYSNSSKAFTDFAEFVLAKLDLSKVHNTREDQSFTFGFYYMEKVRVSTFCFPFTFFFLFFFLLSV